MTEKITETKTVGALVAEDFNRAEVFEHMGIDYCCHGGDTLKEACDKKHLNPQDVINQLESVTPEGGAPAFASWPLDLVLDYVLKKHHRSFHENHDDLLRLVNKEEQILFPQLYEIFQAHEEGREPAPFHCGSVAFPIRQMMLEHDATGEVWQHITDITENFTTPADGCASYRLMNRLLYQFFKDLKEHVALENQIIFPGFIKMEQEG